LVFWLSPTQFSILFEGLDWKAARAELADSLRQGDPNQRNLFTEDFEVAEGELAAASEAADKVLGKASKPKPPVKRNTGNLPDHFERVEEVIEQRRRTAV